MYELIDRINLIINTAAFERQLAAEGVDFIEFQCTWARLSKGRFEALPKAYKSAILAGEAELAGGMELVSA